MFACITILLNYLPCIPATFRINRKTLKFSPSRSDNVSTGLLKGNPGPEFRGLPKGGRRGKLMETAHNILRKARLALKRARSFSRKTSGPERDQAIIRFILTFLFC